MADSAEILEASLLPPDDDGDAPPAREGRRPSLVAVLAAALVLAVAAAGVLGWTVWRDRSRPGSEAEAVVALYTQAFDRHDLTALRATLADRASFSGGEHLEQPVMGPFEGRELDEFYGSLFRADVHLETDGPVQVTGTGPYRVVALQTVRYTVAGVPVTEQGMSLFTLLQLRDRAVILEHVWWRPLAAQAPSMLWAR